MQFQYRFLRLRTPVSPLNHCGLLLGERGGGNTKHIYSCSYSQSSRTAATSINPYPFKRLRNTKINGANLNIYRPLCQESSPESSSVTKDHRLKNKIFLTHKDERGDDGDNSSSSFQTYGNFTPSSNDTEDESSNTSSSTTAGAMDAFAMFADQPDIDDMTYPLVGGTTITLSDDPDLVFKFVANLPPSKDTKTGLNYTVLLRAYYETYRHEQVKFQAADYKNHPRFDGSCDEKLEEFEQLLEKCDLEKNGPDKGKIAWKQYLGTLGIKKVNSPKHLKKMEKAVLKRHALRFGFTEIQHMHHRYISESLFGPGFHWQNFKLSKADCRFLIMAMWRFGYNLRYDRLKEEDMENRKTKGDAYKRRRKLWTYWLEEDKLRNKDLYRGKSVHFLKRDSNNNEDEYDDRVNEDDYDDEEEDDDDDESYDKKNLYKF